MKTPICDFVESYAESKSIRLHMPGHKGNGQTERFDITEIPGADSLYDAAGIISESEQNAGKIFGAETFYSTEGSSLPIRAMLYLALLYAKANGKKPVVLAARNAHKVFLSASALLNIDVNWIYPQTEDSYLACTVTPETLEKELKSNEVTAVYITSPDYLGNIADIKGLAQVCKKHNVLLLVDNAHGAYLKFLPESLHPMDLGADMCCDSAHKTLPVLTGGAYLHISKSADPIFKTNAKNALALFGSTSPSYLILQSLDRINPILSEQFSAALGELTAKVATLKEKLTAKGFKLCGNEPLKITIAPKSYGYEGNKIAEILAQENIICEFADKDFVVMMISSANTQEELDRLKAALLKIEPKEAIITSSPVFKKAKQIISPTEAVLSPIEEIPAEKALGRILAVPNVSCPPAVPILDCGEIIDAHAIDCFKYYGITNCFVVKK